MFRLSASQFALAASALLCAGFAQAQTPPASPLTATPASVGIGFTLPATIGTAQSTSLSVKSGSAPFVIDSTTVPFWLATQDSGGASLMNGTVNAGSPVSVYFQATSAAGSMTEGAYVAYVGFAVNGYAELTVQVTLTVTGSASTLSVMNGTTAVASGGTVNVPWTYGAAAPTLALTLLSSNDPITFSASSTVNGSQTEDWIELPSPSGIAYNYGTTLQVNFAQDALTNATVGSTLSGTITIAYGSSTYTVDITVTVGEPAAAVTGIFPRETAPLSSGALTVIVTGSGFGDVAQGFSTATKVSLTYGPTGGILGPTALGTGVLSAATVTYVNPTTMVLSIPYQDGTGTPVGILTAAGQNVTLTITNTGINSAPVTVTLYVTSNPIINSIADAASLLEPTPGATPTVAPYELMSIFGNNFCPTCATPVVAPVVANRYPTSLTAPASGGNPLTVTFYKSDGVTVVGDAYILFASNTQINALVPSTVVAADNPMQVVVSYNAVLSNTNVTYSAKAVLANPGIFTTSSTGQGQGAILNTDSTVNSSTNKATPGKTIMIYLSGLGIPNSTAANTAGKSAGKYPGSCISIASYVTAAALANPATADGAVLNPSDIETNMLPPCFSTAPAVTIGGKPATVTYAGWVSDSVTGLYQINATIPSAATAGNLPVVVTVTNGTGASAVSANSQAGVTVAVN